VEIGSAAAPATSIGLVRGGAGLSSPPGGPPLGRRG
jgi:hypothetical protein